MATFRISIVRNSLVSLACAGACTLVAAACSDSKSNDAALGGAGNRSRGGATASDGTSGASGESSVGGAEAGGASGNSAGSAHGGANALAGGSSSAGSSATGGAMAAAAGAPGAPIAEFCARSVAGAPAVEPAACVVPPQEPVVGWASVAGNGVATTTGGGDLAPVVVSTADAFAAAVAGPEARVVHLAGSICGDFRIGSNKTIAGCSGRITGRLDLNGSVNVIVRNLTIVGLDCVDSPTDCSDGADAVSIHGRSHHIWFDHHDISDGTDGNLDVVDGSNFVTVSWTKFHYSGYRIDPANSGGHQFSNLVGSDDNVVTDEGLLNVTFHHNWWADNVNQRMPRVRYGKIHVFNNLYTAVNNSYCIGVGMAADVRIENNVFIGVKTPINTTSYEDPRSLSTQVGNVFTTTTGNVVADIGVAFTPSYAYDLLPSAEVESALRTGTGPK